MIDPHRRSGVNDLRPGIDLLNAAPDNLSFFGLAVSIFINNNYHRRCAN
jgi:hypothetical protein